MLKWKFSLYFVPFICCFLNLETSLNFSSLIGEFYVNTQNFDSYDVLWDQSVFITWGGPEEFVIVHI